VGSSEVRVSVPPYLSPPASPVSAYRRDEGARAERVGEVCAGDARAARWAQFLLSLLRVWSLAGRVDEERCPVNSERRQEHRTRRNTIRSLP